MTNIKITKLTLNNYGPFFTLILNNKLFELINRYLLCKIHNSNRNKMLSFSSQRLYAYDFYSFFKLLDKFKLDWDTLTSKNVRNLRDYLDQEKDIDRNTINRKTYLWVEFYQWCKNNNIKVSYTPKYKKFKHNFNTDDSFFAHVNYNKYAFVNEFYLSSLRNTSIYKVLNEDEFQKLKLQLRTEDIMYEAIAIVMVTTGLRIDEVLQLKNTTFPPSNLMSNEKALNYDYIPKGERSTGKKVSCIFPFETWHYISTVIFKLRKQRLSSNNIKTNYLFIDKFGKEIKAYHVQNDEFFVVKSIQADYIKSAVFGDIINVSTKLVGKKSASLIMYQEVSRNGELLFKGTFKLAFLKNFKPSKIPSELFDVFN